MKLRLTRRAAQDLTDIADYIRKQNSQAALRVRAAILESLQSVVLFPQVGRQQKVEGVRKLVTRHYALVFVRILRCERKFLPHSGKRKLKPLIWTEYHLAKKPSQPNRRREEQAEGQPGRRIDRTPAEGLPGAIGHERGQCRDFDRDRYHQPIEPGAGNKCQLDVTEPEAFALAQPTVKPA